MGCWVVEEVNCQRTFILIACHQHHTDSTGGFVASESTRSVSQCCQDTELNVHYSFWGPPLRVRQSNLRQWVGNAIQMFKTVSNMRILQLSTRSAGWGLHKIPTMGTYTDCLYSPLNLIVFVNWERFTVLSFHWKYLTYYNWSWLVLSWIPHKWSFQIHQPLHGPARTSLQSYGLDGVQMIIFRELSSWPAQHVEQVPSACNSREAIRLSPPWKWPCWWVLCSLNLPSTVFSTFSLSVI